MPPLLVTKDGIIIVSALIRFQHRWRRIDAELATFMACRMPLQSEALGAILGPVYIQLQHCVHRFGHVFVPGLCDCETHFTGLLSPCSSRRPNVGGGAVPMIAHMRARFAANAAV